MTWMAKFLNLRDPGEFGYLVTRGELLNAHCANRLSPQEADIPNPSLCELANRAYIGRTEWWHMYRIPKALEELAISLLFESFGESRFNRSAEEYRHLCSLVTNLKDAHHRVNKSLNELHQSGCLAHHLICDFKAGD